MTYKERTQWSELERLLPMLRKSLNKDRKARKIDLIVNELEERINRKNIVLNFLKETYEGIKKRNLKLPEIEEKIREKEIDVLAEIEDLNKRIRKLCEEHNTIVDELEVEETYYRTVSTFLKGIKIRKKQVNPNEFNALLYFMWITRMNSNELFDNFCQMYPWIQLEWKDEIQIKYIL